MSSSSSTSTSSAFDEFLELCEKQGLIGRPEGLTAEDVIDGFNDTPTLKRFFAARGQDPAAAAKQLQDAFSARKDVNDISTYENIDVPTYEEIRHLYPHWTGRRTKRGLPLFAFDVAALTPAVLSAHKQTGAAPPSADPAAPNQTQRTFAFHDTITRFILPLCSAMRDRAQPDADVRGAVYVADISALGLGQAVGVRAYVGNASGILAMCYPEVLGTVYIVNAPFYFSRIWALVKMVVDPKTAEKLVILTRAETLEKLSEVIDVENIPEQFGGKLKYEKGMLPSLDEGIRKRLEWIGEPRETLPPGPIKWLVNEDGGRIAVAVGTSNGERRNEAFAVLRDEPGESMGTP